MRSKRTAQTSLFDAVILDHPVAEELLAFYDFPAVHWTHLRTTNVIESAFATVRHRSSRAKGCVTRRTMLSMIYKMGMSAEKSWRRLRGFRQLGKGFRRVHLWPL